MYNVSNECPIVDILDVDLDAQPQESVSDGEEKQEKQTVRKEINSKKKVTIKIAMI